PPTQSRGLQSDQGLKRLLKLLVVVFVILFVGFAAVYYLSQRPAPTPNLSDRAVSSAEQAVSEKPNDVAARLGLAAAYLQAGRPEDALTQYQEISKADPKNRAALIGAGTIKFQGEDYEGAKAAFGQVVKNSGKGEFSNADPQLESSQYYLGMISLKTGDIPGAIASLQAALAIDDTDADAWHALGGAQVRAGSYQDAVNSYEQALSFIPSGWCDPYAGLAVAYGHLKKQSGADYANAMNLVCTGDTASGMTQLQSLTTGEFHLPALLGLGTASETSGDATNALKYYKLVVAEDPKNIAALSAIARLQGNGPPTSGSSSPSTPASKP
ncbi:MAG: tetratricopeptide repeat protein, partial [Actinomycetes bacterium]